MYNFLSQYWTKQLHNMIDQPMMKPNKITQIVLS